MAASDDGAYDEVGDPSSALHDSILKKGDSSYYYAHGRRENLYEGVHRDQLIGAPKLIGRVKSSSPATPQRSRKSLDSYAWSDGTKSVSVIIMMDSLATLDDANIIVEFDAENDPKAVSLKLVDVDGRGVDHVLELKGLYEAVSSVRTKRSADRTTLKLIMRKASEFSWHKLKA